MVWWLDLFLFDKLTKEREFIDINSKLEISQITVLATNNSIFLTYK